MIEKPPHSGLQALFKRVASLPPQLVASQRLARLGWRGNIPLKEGLQFTVALFREQLSKGLFRL